MSPTGCQETSFHARKPARLVDDRPGAEIPQAE